MTEQLTAVVREGRVVIWTTPRWERHLPPTCVIVLISLHVGANSPDRSPALCSRPKWAGKWPHIGRLLSSDRQDTGNSIIHLRCSENEYRNKLSRSGKRRHLTGLGVQLFKPGPRHRQSWLNSSESFVSPPRPIRIIRPQHKDIKIHRFIKPNQIYFEIMRSSSSRFLHTYVWRMKETSAKNKIPGFF